jgi:iron(III) transport system ATP-binding protein
MRILELKNIWKTFEKNNAPAVMDFSLDVFQGQKIALLGESGCGKTTILRMIAGFEVPDKGSVTLAGKTMSDVSVFVEPENRGIGIVFQDFALFPHKTILQNISYGLFRYAKEIRKEMVNSILQITGLEGLEKRYPHQLSGGQKQRVALARALAPKPNVILLDEPFSNIDTLRKDMMREYIMDILNKTNSTAIIVTHDTKDALAIADKMVILKNGQTIQTGSPEEVFNHPQNRYVADFLKSNVDSAKLASHQT